MGNGKIFENTYGRSDPSRLLETLAADQWFDAFLSLLTLSMQNIFDHFMHEYFHEYLRCSQDICETTNFAI